MAATESRRARRRSGGVPGIAIDAIEVAAYTVPTDAPESDGTAEWESTTLVLVEASGGGETGLGYTYGDVASGAVVHSVLRKVVMGRDALATALDAIRPAVPVYGSGGFTSYTDAQLAEQLGGWAAAGIPRVKMKVGRDPQRDLERLRVAREAIGPGTELYVDANGALSRKRALWFAEQVTRHDVTWFEEPVSSDDLDGLRLMRDRAPGGMDIAAGEYGYTLPYFEAMLSAGAVDCLQADVTRCQGITGFLRVAALCQARSLELSAHCGPAIHVHPCCAAPALRHLEYFYDHVRVERRLFDGIPEPVEGALRPDLTRPGNGLELRRADAERYAR